jgi:hypothetical protein
MEQHTHTMNMLFAQLGLPDSPKEVEKFIGKHKLKSQEKLHEATFWSESQSMLIKEMWKADSDWCVVIDELNARLHH